MMKITEMAIAEAKEKGYDVIIVDEAGTYWEEGCGVWVSVFDHWTNEENAFDGAEVIRENYCDNEKICYINVAGEF